MPVLAIFTSPTIDRKQYDALRNEVQWDKTHPEGAVFHAASFDENGGAHVADVWESREQLDRFVGTRLMPAMQKLGATPPAVEVFDAHNINAFPTVGRYTLK